MDKRLFVVLVAAFMAAGCSSEKTESNAPSVARAPAAAGDDTVAAVSQAGGSVAAALRFALPTKPLVGAQSELRLDVSAPEAVPQLLIQAEAETISIDPATAKAGIAIEAGEKASHALRITPQREGVTRITVRLRNGADGAESVYDIPVLVGPAGG